MTGNEEKEGLRKLPVEILCGAGDADRCSQSIVVTIGDLFRDDIDTKLVLFNVGHGEQDSTMPQERRQFLEHGNESSGLELGLRLKAASLGEGCTICGIEVCRGRESP